MNNNAGSNLAKNLKQLREMRNLTQDQLARASGLPRSTWTNLESGGANPTLSVLVRVAASLHISVEELIGTPRAECQFYPSQSLKSSRRGNVILRQLLPDALDSLNVERMEFPLEARMIGVPHRSGTREHLTCESGEIELTVAGQRWKLSPGDVVVFRGDQKHSYFNSGTRTAVGYSVVALGKVT